MNSYQKAVLILSLIGLPLGLLFMHGMEYRGTGAAAIAGVGTVAALIYALRTPKAESRVSAESRPGNG